jgi:acyl carrier protein
VSTSTPTETVRRVLDTHAKLTVPADTLAPDADLYAAGMTSHASVNVMLAVEDAFEVEFPDALLTKSTFCSIGAISSAVESLLDAAA